MPITLRKWADKNNISYRTARQWAMSGKIPAKMQMVEVPVKIVRRTETYVIQHNATVPGQVKSKK